MANQLGTFLRKLVIKKATKEPKRLNKKNKSEASRTARHNAYLDKHKKTAVSSQFGSGKVVEVEIKKYSSEYDNKFYNTAYKIKKVGKFLEDPSLPGMVRFDGFWIKRDAAMRLKEMKGET